MRSRLASLLIPRGTSAPSLAAAAVAAVAVVTASPGAHAQPSTPEVSLRADADEIEVGETVGVTLSAMSDSSTPQPSDPTLRTPPGWAASAPVISTQTRMSIVNGHVTQRSGLTATWQLQPRGPGTFDVGPAAFIVGGRRLQAGSVRIVVKPASGKPKLRGRTRRRDPFAGIFGFDPFDDDRRKPTLNDVLEPPPPDPQLSLDAPLEPQCFLRGVVDKSAAVVGEQVTLSIYLYTQPRMFQVVDPHEPTAPEFFQRAVASGDTEAHAVNVGGARWAVQLVRKIALFPLHPGDLTVGPMTITMLGPGLRGGGMRGGLLRASKPLEVHVTEPPPGPRPAGYVMGDVGSYNLTVSVEPRRVEAGGSIAVTALLKGVGNVPQNLRLPERKGVTWLEPEMHEAIDASNGVVAGSRSFTYVVKLSEPGKIALGELGVSFWNPKLKEYQTARAPLGTVEVTGQAPAAPAGGTGERDPFSAVPAYRPSPSAYAAPSAPFTDSAWFWLALAGSPASVLLLDGASRAARALLDARRQRADSAHTRVKQALDEAAAAAAASDGKAAASAVERALVLAIDAACGVKLRALMRDEIRPTLEREGVPAALADEVHETLLACDAWRFEPGASPAGGSPVERAVKLTRSLARLKRPA
jgi:hypothetical protein